MAKKEEKEDGGECQPENPTDFRANGETDL